MSKNYKYKKLKVRGNLWQQFKDSPLIAPILKKFLPVRPRKPIVCEHNRVDYITVKSLAIKQINIIQSLADVIAKSEKQTDHIKKEAIRQLDKLKAENQVLARVNVEQNAEIEKLTKRLEVMTHVN